MKLRKLFTLMLLCCLFGEVMAQTTWQQPRVTPVYLDSVRMKKTSDEVYLEQLNSLKSTIMANDIEIKNCIDQVKTALKNINTGMKNNKAERSFLKKDEKLLKSQKKMRDDENKNIEKELKVLSKSKDYSAEEKSTRIGQLNDRIAKNRQESSLQTERMQDIEDKYKRIDESDRSLTIQKGEAEKQMDLLNQLKTSSKVDSDRVKNEIKITKLNIKSKAE